MEAFAAAGAAEAVRTSDAGAVSDEHAATGPVVADMEGQNGGVSDTGTGGYGEHDKFHRGLRDGEGNEGARREEMQGRSIDVRKGDDIENEEVAGKPLADGGHELGAAGLRAAAEAGRVEGCPERREPVEIGALHGAGKAPGPAKDGKGNKRWRQKEEPGREVLAEVRKLPEIASNVEQAAELALRVITERREHGEGIEPIRVPFSQQTKSSMFSGPKSNCSDSPLAKRAILLAMAGSEGSIRMSAQWGNRRPSEVRPRTVAKALSTAALQLAAASSVVMLLGIFGARWALRLANASTV